jgi:hypothetical protein
MSQTKTVTSNATVKTVRKIMETPQSNVETEIEIPRSIYNKLVNRVLTAEKNSDRMMVENEVNLKKTDQKLSHYNCLLKKEQEKNKQLEEKLRFYEEKKNEKIDVMEIEENPEERNKYCKELYAKLMKDAEKELEEWKRTIGSN